MAFDRYNRKIGLHERIVSMIDGVLRDADKRRQIPYHRKEEWADKIIREVKNEI